MPRLNTKPNIPDQDGFYADLIEAHEGLDDEQSLGLNARLIMLLANHIGSRDILKQAITAAANPGKEKLT
jgi:hypothetical protein